MKSLFKGTCVLGLSRMISVFLRLQDDELWLWQNSVRQNGEQKYPRNLGMQEKIERMIDCTLQYVHRSNVVTKTKLIDEGIDKIIIGKTRWTL